MQTWFCFVSLVLLGLFYVLLHGNEQTQLPGQRSAQLPGQITEFPASPGLSTGAGLPQREYK